MKKILLVAALLSSTMARAENVGVNVDKVTPESNQETVISIKKGDIKNNANVKKYEIHSGSEDINGDKAPLKKTAEENWKKACTEWKQEFKEQNKDNKIISQNCGKMECVKEGVESTCSSKAQYKIKALVEE